MTAKLDFEQRKRAVKLMERMADDDYAAEIAFDYIHLQDVNAALLEALKNLLALSRPHFSDSTQILALNLAEAAIAKAKEE